MLRIYSLVAAGLALLGGGTPVRGPRGDSKGPDSAQVARFLTALGSADPVICEMAVDNIGNGWGWHSRRAAVGVLHDRSQAERAARNAFSNDVEDPKAVPLLVDRLGDPNPCVRRAAARMLGSDRSDLARRMLRAKLRDPQPLIREAAAFGAGQRDDHEAYDDLVRGLKDPEVSVVRMSVWALGELEDHRAVALLTPLLDHDDTGVRAASVWSLG